MYGRRSTCVGRGVAWLVGGESADGDFSCVFCGRCGEASGSECAVGVARKGARVIVKSLPANAPTVEVEGGSTVPLSGGRVSEESCQPTRKVIVIGKRVAEDGDE